MSAHWTDPWVRQIARLQADLTTVTAELSLQRDMVAEAIRSQNVTADALVAERAAHEETKRALREARLKALLTPGGGTEAKP